MTEPYRVVVADPPWLFKDALPGKARGASKNYRCLPIGEIKSFLADHSFEVADDAILLLWRVAAMQQEALDVCRAWGFTPKSEIVWRKLTRSGRVHFGMGRTVRNSHETAIVATRGRSIVQCKSVRSIFDAAMGRHSAKPIAFFRLVERLAPGPYLELFAREARPGWTTFGDEIQVEAAE